MTRAYGDPLAILQRRARALARGSTDLEDHASLELLVIKVSSRRLGFPVDQVQQILRNPGLCLLPGDCGELVGLVPARAGVVPVADLGALLGGRPQPNRALIVLLDGGTSPPVGFLVDEAEAVVRLPSGDVRSRPRSDGGPFLERGITRDGVVVLDVDLLVADPRLTTDTTGRESSRPAAEQETHASHHDR